MTPEEQLEIYACGLVLLRSSHHALDEVAQRIAEHSGELLPLLTLAGTQDDDAARSVLTAIVAAATARAAGADEAAQGTITRAALGLDAGRARLARAAGIDLSAFHQLPDALDALVPAANAAAGFAAPRVDGSVLATLSYEAAWLERAARLGDLHQGALMPLVASQLLFLAHTFVDRIAPRTGERRSPAEALGELLMLPDTDEALLVAMVRALGPLPVGTVVELEDGSWAVVSQPASWERALSPEVRVVASPDGHALPTPELRTGVTVRRALAPAQARFNPARAFFAVVSDT